MIVRTCLAVAASLAFAAQAQAAPAKASPMPARATAANDAQAAALRAWIGSLAEWMHPINMINNDEVELLKGLVGGSQVSKTFAADPKAGAAWAADWEKARRLELEALRGKVAALPTALPPAPAVLSRDPDMATVSGALLDYLKTVRANADSSDTLASDLLSLIVKAAGGDKASADMLDVRAMDVTIAMLRGEQASVEAGTAFLRAGDPERDVGRTTMEGDMALIEAINFIKLTRMDQHPNAAEYATRMRAHAQALKLAAQQAVLDAKSSQAAQAANAVANAAVGDRLTRIYATYSESAEIEGQIAQAFLTIADHVEKNDLATSPEAAMAFKSLDPLVQKNVALDQQRNRIMAGQQ